jgi:hypothetical protein
VIWSRILSLLDHDGTLYRNKTEYKNSFKLAVGRLKDRDRPNLPLSIHVLNDCHSQSNRNTCLGVKIAFHFQHAIVHEAKRPVHEIRFRLRTYCTVDTTDWFYIILFYNEAALSAAIKISITLHFWLVDFGCIVLHFCCWNKRIVPRKKSIAEDE